MGLSICLKINPCTTVPPTVLATKENQSFEMKYLYNNSQKFMPGIYPYIMFNNFLSSLLL